jgi:hypothetical protein
MSVYASSTGVSSPGITYELKPFIGRTTHILKHRANSQPVKLQIFERSYEKCYVEKPLWELTWSERPEGFFVPTVGSSSAPFCSMEYAYFPARGQGTGPMVHIRTYMSKERGVTSARHLIEKFSVASSNDMLTRTCHQFLRSYHSPSIRRPCRVHL